MSRSVRVARLRGNLEKKQEESGDQSPSNARSNSTANLSGNLSAHSSVLLDVRMGGGSRPLRFPLVYSVHQVIETIDPTYTAGLPSPSLYVTRSAIWLDPARVLGSYCLDNLVRPLLLHPKCFPDTVIRRRSF